MTGHPATPPTRAIVVEECDNPSSAYFLFPALAHLPCPVTRRSFADLPGPAELDGAMVVLARYVPGGWVRLLTAARPRLSRLAFFMDDDLFDTAASRGAPLHYRFKLWRLAARRRDWLLSQKAEFWVSTPALMEKYAAWGPRLVLPAPLPAGAASPDADTRRIFYHGTASHNPDIRWLFPVMAEVLAKNPRLALEIVGKRAVATLFKPLPRVTVVHPMPWPAYRIFAATPGRHVGLAPQLDSAFNAARSYTKFCDITRSGAVGVYAAGSACADVVEHEKDGLVVPMQPAAWVAAITRLAGDDGLRAAMLQNAQDKLAELSRRAEASHARLFAAPPGTPEGAPDAGATDA
ncbi:glycosyltransferase family 4 protein [Desulfovibrio sulfodismutans]|uniref:Glycosyltransferase family 4 protein n=2 Tax=Desulfolutivibrio sulfodismutans TaxID=63561 RepID=A0A7K3NQL1_9BACT|nr:glycosyltransferase family 4 protein [Desulfolutivibrio sulfodismutans]QLA14476.1 glycosyltransferase family 1 protein [Desulfolutivibrio sulfodismutans DSM 3696]